MNDSLIFNQKIEIELSREDSILKEGGAVFKGYDIESGRIIACKLLDMQGDYPQKMEQIKGEASALMRLEKEYINVPRLYGIVDCKEEKQAWLLSEWIEGPTLTERMMESLQPGVFLQYMEQLSEILMVLEKCRIVHKDIKPDNIIINRNKYTGRENVFLIDFDISSNLAIRGEGTKGYRAPEMWNSSSNIHRDKVDLFSIGVIMYEYFSKAIPEKGIDYITDPLGKKEWKKFISPREKNDEVIEEIDKLIIKLMKFNPDDRLKNASDLRRSIRECIKVYRRRM